MSYYDSEEEDEEYYGVETRAGGYVVPLQRDGAPLPRGTLAAARAAAAGGGGGDQAGVLSRRTGGRAWDADAPPNEYAPLAVDNAPALSPYASRPPTQWDAEVEDPSWERHLAAQRAAARGGQQQATQQQQAEMQQQQQQAMQAQQQQRQQAMQAQQAMQQAQQQAAMPQSRPASSARQAASSVAGTEEGDVTDADSEATLGPTTSARATPSGLQRQQEVAAALAAQRAAAEQQQQQAQRRALEQQQAAAAEAARQAEQQRAFEARQAARAAAEREARAQAAAAAAEAAAEREMLAAKAARPPPQQAQRSAPPPQPSSRRAPEEARILVADPVAFSEAGQPPASQFSAAQSNLDRALAALATPGAAPDALSSALRVVTKECGVGNGADVVAGGGVPLVVAALRSHPGAPAVCADACLVLGMVTQESDAAAAARASPPAADGTAVAAVAAALGAHPSVMALQATGAWALWGLVRGSPGNARRAVAAGAPEQLVAAMLAHRSSPEVAQSAAGALLAIAATGAPGQAAVAAAGGVSAVKKAMRTHASITFRGEFDALRGWLKSGGSK